MYSTTCQKSSSYTMQVFQSPSRDDNRPFATSVLSSGLSLSPWIISDDSSQFDVDRGSTACSVACLEFAKLVLRHAEDTNTDPHRFLTVILRTQFFGVRYLLK